MNKKDVATIFTQVIEKPERKMLIKRGVKAKEYFAYCEEVGCDIWGLLCSVKEAVDEPVGMWLPDQYRPAGTSRRSRIYRRQTGKEKKLKIRQ